MANFPAEDASVADVQTSALTDALNGLKHTKRTGWILFAVISAVTLTVVIGLANAGGEAISWIIAALFGGAFGLIGVAGWVKKSHERDVMPILASTLNLSHQKTGSQFFETIPKNFIPRGGRRNCDDLMSGRMADRGFRFAEVKTETGGKNSRVLFDGVVVEVSTRAPLPEFLIAQVSQTKGFWIFKGNVNVEEMARSHTAWGKDQKEYGLWSPYSKPGEVKEMQVLMDRLVAMGPQLSAGSALYSAACTGRNLYVALSHKHELFQIGGLFADDARIMSDIRSATADLQVPMSLAAEVIRAEEAIHAASS